MDEVLSGTTTGSRVREFLPTPVLTNHPVDVGLRSEAAIISELLRRDYYVLEPRGFNHRYDLVIDTGTRFLRVQCKTGRLRRGSVLFRTASVRSNTRSAVARSYKDEVDLFMVFCRETASVYVIPVEEAPTGECALRVDPAANNQVSGIRWAADYLLPPPGELRSGPICHVDSMVKPE